MQPFNSSNPIREDAPHTVIVEAKDKKKSLTLWVNLFISLLAWLIGDDVVAQLNGVANPEVVGHIVATAVSIVNAYNIVQRLFTRTPLKGSPGLTKSLSGR